MVRSFVVTVQSGASESEWSKMAEIHVYASNGIARTQLLQMEQEEFDRVRPLYSTALPWAFCLVDGKPKVWPPNMHGVKIEIDPVCYDMQSVASLLER